MVASQPEPEWDDQERGWMIALDTMRKMTCTGCGGWLPETTTTPAEDYAVPPPHRCGRCTALGSLQEVYAKDSHQTHALKWHAMKRG